MSRRSSWLLFMLPAAIGSCTTSSIGLDLTVRGVLNFFITRASTSAGALATAYVNDSGAFGAPLVELQSNQVFSANGTTLAKTFILTTHAAAIGSVDAPSQYTVTFNNAGTLGSMLVTPPVDFTSATPAAGTAVSKTGFNVGWSPSGDANVKVDIEIRGLKPDGSDENTDPDPETKTIRNLPDSGTAAIGAADLQTFNTGAITVKITRVREFPQSIGFASGSVRVEIYKEIALTLGA